MKKTFLIAACGVSMQLFSQSPIYIDQDATGTNDGSSWENAFTSFEMIEDVLAHGSEIWMAEGIYKITGATETSAFAWFTDSVKIYGGFAGTEESIDDRDWLNHETVFSGEIGVDGDESDNMNTVLYGPLEEDFPMTYSLIDGIVIEGGNSKNVGFLQNYAGGGILLGYSPGDVHFRNCTVRNNRARSGAGVYITGEYVADLNIIFENCRFSNNRSTSGAPFECNTKGNNLTVSFLNCLFDNNEIFDNPDFSVGWSGHGGVLLAEDGGNLDIQFNNCTWANNTNAGTGALHTMLPIYRRNAGGTAEVTFRNCIFNENDNAANNFQVGWEDVDNTTDDMDVNIDHSLFQDTTGLRYTSAINLFKEDALFVNPAAMNYTLSDDSPAINVGNTEAVIDFISLTDLSGAVRIQGGIIDLGCYESSIVDDLGKDHLAPLQISLFPNPTNGQIQLKSTEKIQYVEVLNLSGESLLKSTATTINLTSFSAGIYLIHIYTNNAVIQQKIIKE